MVDVSYIPDITGYSTQEDIINNVNTVKYFTQRIAADHNNLSTDCGANLTVQLNSIYNALYDNVGLFKSYKALLNFVSLFTETEMYKFLMAKNPMAGELENLLAEAKQFDK